MSAKKVLIVDDSASMRQMVSFTLRRAGFDVVEAADGQEAEQRLTQTPVSLVVTDLNMPVMDGIELTKRVRGSSSSRFVPILVLTTETEVERRQAARAAGATGWIVKPFSPEQFLATVAKVVPK